MKWDFWATLNKKYKNYLHCRSSAQGNFQSVQVSLFPTETTCRRYNTPTSFKNEKLNVKLTYN
jgi:hypothetical protein